MHVITQNCLLFIWIHTLTPVIAQDCKVEDFLNSPDYDSNLDTTGLAASYPIGSRTSVHCDVGYAGGISLICQQNGKWRPQGPKCALKPCGHPGDAEFATFHVVQGDDFVFGAEVQYTCIEGYEMTSRISNRRCTSNGWEGHLPVCHAQHCPRIHVENNVQVTGDYEGAPYGSVLQFRCKSRNLILHGAARIHCVENGRWSNEAPTCIEVKCTAPSIDNGRVLDHFPEYHKGQTLSFECNRKFKRSVHLPTRCIKVGNKAQWIPAPLCDPVTCNLNPPSQGTTYEPDARSFSPGDAITVACKSGYFIGVHSVTSRRIHCKDDGDWDFSPMCEEITCGAPHDPGLDSKDYNGQYKYRLHDTFQYTCKPDYKHDSHIAPATATCSATGWTPQPLCEEITCGAPQDPGLDWKDYNGQYKYRLHDPFQYTCNPGYKHDSRDAPATATCSATGWTPQPLCEARCVIPKVENGFTYRSYEGKLYYACDEKYKLFGFTKGWWGVTTCEEGKWKWLPLGPPRCIEHDKCGDIPKILHSKMGDVSDLRANYSKGQVIRFDCEDGYSPQNLTIICTNGRWDFESTTNCTLTEKPCQLPPRVANAFVEYENQVEYKSGTHITYICRDNYLMDGGENTITCKDGEWENKSLHCSITCPAPVPPADAPVPPADGQVIIEGDGVPMPVGRILRFSCGTGYTLRGTAQMTCGENGNWDHPFPSCAVVSCPVPPEDLQVLIEGDGVPMSVGHILRFSCSTGYTLRGTAQLTCGENGNWDNPFPSCAVKPTRCGKPPSLDDGDFTGVIETHYDHNERVEYLCQRFYTMDGDPYRTCQDGQWIGQMRCLKACTLALDDEMDERNIQFRYSTQTKLFAQHNGFIEFQCKRSDQSSDIPLRQQCNDGHMVLPNCSVQR